MSSSQAIFQSSHLPARASVRLAWLLWLHWLKSDILVYKGIQCAPPWLTLPPTPVHPYSIEGLTQLQVEFANKIGSRILRGRLVEKGGFIARVLASDPFRVLG